MQRKSPALRKTGEHVSEELSRRVLMALEPLVGGPGAADMRELVCELGIQFEECDLTRQFGQAHHSYRASVPALLPIPRKHRQPQPDHDCA